MQTILPPSGNTMKILGKPKPAEHGLRWMTYVAAQPVEGGVLVFHTLTRALLLLTQEEYTAPDAVAELRSSWFRVPQEMDDMKYPTGCVLSAARCRRNRSILQAIPFLPPRTATPGAFTATRWGAPASP